MRQMLSYWWSINWLLHHVQILLHFITTQLVAALCAKIFFFITNQLVAAQSAKCSSFFCNNSTDCFCIHKMLSYWKWLYCLVAKLNAPCSHIAVLLHMQITQMSWRLVFAPNVHCAMFANSFSHFLCFLCISFPQCAFISTKDRCRKKLWYLTVSRQVSLFVNNRNSGINKARYTAKPVACG